MFRRQNNRLPREFPGEAHSSGIRLSRSLKQAYSEIVPVLHGQGNGASLTLLGRRRDDPSKLETLLTRPWTLGEPVRIVWVDSPAPSIV